jgi:hypothetical protein
MWIKERHFFDRFSLVQESASLADEYAAVFPRCQGRATGEWTPLYLNQWWAPRLIAQAAPCAKILILVRDPIERWRSEMTYLRPGPNLAANSVDRGLYARHIKWMLRWVPRERVLILQFEAVCREPQAWARRTFEHLGLDASTVIDFGGDRNPAAHAKVELGPHREMLRMLYASDVRDLSVLMGDDFDPALWENFNV